MGYAWAPTRQKPALGADPRGYEKLALERNVRRATQHSATHTIGWKAHGAVSVLLLHSDTGDPCRAEIARVCKYVLCYGRRGVEQPKIQRQIWKPAALRVDERCDAKALCAKILDTTSTRRMITKADRTVEAGNLPICGALGISAKYPYLGSECNKKRGSRGLGLLP